MSHLQTLKSKQRSDTGRAGGGGGGVVQRERAHRRERESGAPRHHDTQTHVHPQKCCRAASFLLPPAIEDFVDENSIWFPNCYDQTLIKPSAPKTTFLGFCGSLLNREQLLNFLADKYGLKKDIWLLGDDMVQAVSSYRVHFNINLANDINYRSFETIGCETLLLTNHNPQYEKLGFRDGENCLMYEDIESLCRKIEACQTDPEMVGTISRAGYKLSEQHTFDIRAAKLMSIYKELE